MAPESEFTLRLLSLWDEDRQGFERALAFRKEQVKSPWTPKAWWVAAVGTYRFEMARRLERALPVLGTEERAGLLETFQGCPEVLDFLRASV